MTCKGTCTSVAALRGIQYEAGRLPRDPFTGRSVQAGTYGPWKRCRTCDVLIIWQGIFCPCCGGRTASRPRACRRSRTVRDAEEKRRRMAAVQGKPMPSSAVVAPTATAAPAAV